MALPAVGDANYPTPEEVRSTLLASVYFASGGTANVKPKSDHYIRMDAIAKRVSVAIANNRIALSNFSPLSATGDDLATLCALFGVTKRAASSSSGFAIVTCTGVVTIPANFACTAPNGTKLKTRTANTVVSGSEVEVIAVDTGDATNIDAGTVLTWDSAAIGALAQTAVVADGDIDGGEDEDDDDKLRQRLLSRLAFPGVGGNWSQIAQWAEESTSAVEAAFVYPAVRGPSSLDVAVTKEATDRTLSSSAVSLVRSYILGKMPGFADINVTAVDPEEVDVILDAKLPYPVSAGGPGGGWRDASPWPDSTPAASASQSGTPDLVFANANPDTITRSAGSWITDRFLPGMTIAVTNTVSNNGTYVIASMTATVLTMTSAAALSVETAAAVPAGSVTSSAQVPARVLSKTGNTLLLSCHSSSAPYSKARFGIWDPDAEEMREFTVSSVDGGSTSGAYLITVDAASSDSTSFIEDGEVPSGYYLSTGAVNLSTYASNFLSAMQSLGPGEKTASSDILPRGLRKPGIETRWPRALTAVQIAAVTNASHEVSDLQYGYRFDTGTASSRSTPSVTSSTADAPRILVLNHFALRKL